MRRILLVFVVMAVMAAMVAVMAAPAFAVPATGKGGGGKSETSGKEFAPGQVKKGFWCAPGVQCG